VNFSDPFGLCPPTTPAEVLPCAGQMAAPAMALFQSLFKAMTLVLPMGEGAGAITSLGLGGRAAEVGVQANRAAGLAGEAAVAREAAAKGITIVGSQVAARTSQGLRVIDHLVQQADGSLVALEVKTGGGVRTAAQLAKDAAMETEGATLVGKNAPDALRGLTVQIPTTEVRPW